MSSHTPGPWHVNHAGGAKHGQEFKISEYFVYAPETQDDVGICSDVIDPLTQKPSKANARLIAAAPDLLAALESAWQWMDGQSDAQSKGGHATFDLMMLREQRDIARAAIDKATGES